MSRMNHASSALLVALIVTVGCVSRDEALEPSEPNDPTALARDNLHFDDLGLNQLQAIGSHNSYKEAIAPNLLDEYGPPGDARREALDYWHPSLTRQLDHGLRKLEIDVFHDPEGGLFAEPWGAGLDDVPHDPGGVLEEPGFKVLHVQDLDFRSNCLTLALCLEEVVSWSEAHPGHVPVVISLNTKDQAYDRPRWVTPRPFNGPALAALDQAIRSFVPAERLLEPADVRGDFATLEQAVLERGWPLLGEVRGRLLLVLDQGDPKRAAYLDAVAEPVMFPNAEPGTPWAAFRIINDPIGQREEIEAAVAAGYLVRTRADADTREARSGNTARREAAFASGAHYISTDYYLPEQTLTTGYTVKLPGAAHEGARAEGTAGPVARASRCNPVTAPTACTVPAP